MERDGFLGTNLLATETGDTAIRVDHGDIILHGKGGPGALIDAGTAARAPFRIGLRPQTRTIDEQFLEGLAPVNRFAANQARLLMGVLAYNLLHRLRQFYLLGVEVERSAEWLIKRPIKVGAKVVHHDRRWHVHVASAFPLAR